MKKGKEHPVARAHITPKNSWILSFLSACLNKDKRGAILAT